MFRWSRRNRKEYFGCKRKCVFCYVFIYFEPHSLHWQTQRRISLCSIQRYKLNKDTFLRNSLFSWRVLFYMPKGNVKILCVLLLFESYSFFWTFLWKQFITFAYILSNKTVFWYLIENGKRSMTENLLPNIIKTFLLFVKKDYKESVNIIRILLLQWIIPNQNVTNIICIYQLNRFCIICRFEVY